MRKLFLATAVLIVGVTLLYAPPKKQSGKSFYLTVTDHDGAETPFACVPRFHMASIYEILEPTGLIYDSNLGVVQDDSGSGPPSLAFGWIRTGGVARGALTPFEANCDAYQSNTPSMDGTLGFLSDPGQGGTRIGSAWGGTIDSCDMPNPVWCVSD